MDFYFDFISPYAYVAWTQIHALAERHQRQVNAVPVLFAGLLNAHGHKGPAEIPAKRVYVFKDVYRKAHRLGVPLMPPPSHPFNPLLSLRAVSFVKDPAQQRRFIDALYAAVWAGGGGVESEQAIAAIAERVGLPAADVIAYAKSDEAKNTLRSNTERAIELGVFGVPTVVVGGELFWGTDSLETLEVYLDGGDPVPADLLERWQHIVPSATRPGGRV